MNKKILILANADVGLYKFRKELLLALQRENNSLYLGVPKGEWTEKLQQMGCKISDTPLKRRNVNLFEEGKLLVSYLKLIREIRPDLILTYTIKPNLYGGLAARWCKCACVVNITGLGSVFQSDSRLKQFVILLYRQACRYAQKVFFENEENGRQFVRYGIVREEQVCCLKGAGVNLEEYPLLEYPGEEEIHFLYLGRIMKEKGVEELFRAFTQLKRHFPKVMLEMAGPCEEDYREEIKMLEAQHILRYHGVQKQVLPFLRHSHCLILPSWHEGMANTLLEAGAVGRPLITSDIPGCREAVQEGENGFLIPPGDVSALEEKMEKFVNLPFEKKREMGEASRKWMEQNFNRKVVVEETLAQLRKEKGEKEYASPVSHFTGI